VDQAQSSIATLIKTEEIANPWSDAAICFSEVPKSSGLAKDFARDRQGVDIFSWKNYSESQKAADAARGKKRNPEHKSVLNNGNILQWSG
jgi:hypothetical protein